MLPDAYELPAAIVLVLGGALACFAGYRLFRLVLGIYGFVLGAAIASSMVDPSSTLAILIAAVVGGLIGSAVLVFAYFVGIAIVGAGLGALVVHVAWRQLATGDPAPLVVVVASVAGAIGAMLLQRYVIIVATAFGGAWTIIVGGLAAASSRATEAMAASRDAWILYPMGPSSNGRWVAAWIVLGLVGTAVQLGVTAKKK